MSIDTMAAQGGTGARRLGKPKYRRHNRSFYMVTHIILPPLRPRGSFKKRGNARSPLSYHRGDGYLSYIFPALRIISGPPFRLFCWAAELYTCNGLRQGAKRNAIVVVPESIGRQRRRRVRSAGDNHHPQGAYPSLPISPLHIQLWPHDGEHLPFRLFRPTVRLCIPRRPHHRPPPLPRTRNRRCHGGAAPPPVVGSDRRLFVPPSPQVRMGNRSRSVPRRIDRCAEISGRRHCRRTVASSPRDRPLGEGGGDYRGKFRFGTRVGQIDGGAGGASRDYVPFRIQVPEGRGGNRRRGVAGQRGPHRKRRRQGQGAVTGPGLLRIIGPI
mmetsp:Transcript_57206/g.170553  ORF Transcript_57206/g.170553 Transcript_57206/m.170553 type:complete len:327 (+) Transcript_57206:219-1199(+)